MEAPVRIGIATDTVAENLEGESPSANRMEMKASEAQGRQAQERGTQRVLPLERVIERVCQAVGVRAEELRGSGRRAAVSRARAGVAYLWLEWLGQSGPAAARALGGTSGDDLQGSTVWPPGGGVVGAAVRQC